mmetsp:Transcript_110096/g.322071  ORF Transcript_110096/g.322071 Transcript_110096/m.322071 type:complete len:282 (+) Transcript_110096:213-1058(+)
MRASQRRTEKKPLEALAAAPAASPETSPTRRRLEGRSSVASQMEPDMCTEGLPSTPVLAPSAPPSAAQTSPASVWAAQQRSASCSGTSARPELAGTPLTWAAWARSRHRCVHRNSAGPRTKPCPAPSVTAVKSPQRPSFEAAPGLPPAPTLPSPVGRRAAMSTTDSAQRPSARFRAPWSQGQSFARPALAGRIAQHRLGPLNAQMRVSTSVGSAGRTPAATSTSGAVLASLPGVSWSALTPACASSARERTKKSSSVMEAAGACFRPRAMLASLLRWEPPG